METLKMYNGNNQEVRKDLPKIVCLTTYINDVALKHIEKNTGLKFVKTPWWYEALPQTSNQIVRLFLTYNFKTRYFDNWDYSNTIMLKLDYHRGFDVDTICSDCCIENNIGVHGDNKTKRLCC